MTTTIAALPDHNLLSDPLWQRLFHAYRHVITPCGTRAGSPTWRPAAASTTSAPTSVTALS